MLATTYRAQDMQQALAMVREALGPDALIVGSRRVEGAQLQRCVEVQAMPYSQAGQADPAASGIARTDASNLGKLLRRRGVPKPLCLELVQRVRAHLGSDPRDANQLRSGLTQALRRMLRFGGIAEASARVQVLIGPTGVGKTTTLAKLAAQSALVERRKTALVCMDDYRIGGSEQLERYADLIGIPIAFASDAASLAKALRGHADAQAVFVDTAGRSPRDADAWRHTTTSWAELDEAVEVHLCLPACIGLGDLQPTLERYQSLQPTHLLLTKLDEMWTAGALVAAPHAAALPLSYLTHGQRVPEDIQPASASSLAAWLCGEEKE